MEKSWWQISVTCKDPESLAEQAMDIGCAGGELTDDSVKLYIECEKENLENVSNALKSLGAEEISIEPFTDKNWVLECEELWEPVEIGALTIVPVLDTDSSQIQEASAHNVFVLPGRGFGTGHHPSTKKCIEYLQLPVVQKLSPKSVLDVGTGSGVLAIVAAKLFESSVDAYEIEESAVQNAKENLTLNNFGHLVTLYHEPFVSTEKQYNLILANLYMEVLVPMEPALRAALLPDGLLMMAGVTADTSEVLEKAYLEAGWKQVIHQQEGEWQSYVWSR